jgi:NAD/NADP transhydrogenase beta subunit
MAEPLLSNAQEIGTLIAGLLTLAVFSYLWADNAVYRAVEHLFIGVSAGYVAVVALQRVIVPLSIEPALQSGPSWNNLLPLGLSLLLLCRFVRPVAWLANLPLGIAVGTGVGLGLTGVIAGTLVPQLFAAVPSVPGEVGVLVGAACLLVVMLAFGYTFTEKHLDHKLARLIISAGRLVAMFALGAVFADLATSRLTLLSGRLYFLLHDWLSIMRGGL